MKKRHIKNSPYFFVPPASRRGQGEMWWILGFAMLVLIVAGILIYVFSSKIGGFEKSTESCALKGGECKSSCAINENEIANTNCPTDKANCCVGIFAK